MPSRLPFFLPSSREKEGFWVKLCNFHERKVETMEERKKLSNVHWSTVALLLAFNCTIGCVHVEASLEGFGRTIWGMQLGNGAREGFTRWFVARGGATAIRVRWLASP